jgi:hypothetical protein
VNLVIGSPLNLIGGSEKVGASRCRLHRKISLRRRSAQKDFRTELSRPSPAPGAPGGRVPRPLPPARNQRSRFLDLFGRLLSVNRWLRRNLDRLKRQISKQVKAFYEPFQPTNSAHSRRASSTCSSAAASTSSTTANVIPPLPTTAESPLRHQFGSTSDGLTGEMPRDRQ